MTENDQSPARSGVRDARRRARYGSARDWFRSPRRCTRSLRPRPGGTPCRPTAHGSCGPGTMCAMAVVHAVLDSARDIHLWAEDVALDGDGPARAVSGIPSESGGLDHPFAARSVAIETVDGPVSEYRLADPGLALTLPTNAGGPLPSTRAAGPIRRRRHHVDVVARTDRLASRPRMRSACCSRSRSDRTPGSARASGSSPASPCWRPSSLRVDVSCRSPIAARGRGRGRVRWSIAPGAGDEATHRHARRRDARRVPGGRQCDPRHRGGSRCGASKSSIDSSMPRSREEAAALDLDQWPRGRSMTAALDRWRETVRPRTGPYRTLFRLGEPGRALDDVPGPAADDAVPATGSQAPWTLEVLVAARDDPSLVLPAALVWTDPGPLLAASGRRSLSARSGGGPSRRPRPRDASPPSAREPARHTRTWRDRTRH